MLFQLLGLLLLWIGCTQLLGCEKIALAKTPPKQPIPSNSLLAKEAQTRFWETLHQGRYDQIGSVTRLMTAAYIMNPNDPQLASHLGFLHIWAISERQRLQKLDPLIVDQIILAKKYFNDARELNPNDARLTGFHGVTQLVEGKIFNDQREQVRGYFTLKRAIKEWSQFNYFTAGYPLSTLLSDDKLFREGLEYQWKNINVCIGRNIDRNNPSFAPYMHLQTTEGPNRACWNSWIAPYNFEGFFLNMGDMLVKSGDWQTAIKIYQNAKLANNYKHWPYRAVLEQRIENAQKNVRLFNRDIPLTEKPPEPTIMFNSKFSCMACHQETK